MVTREPARRVMRTLMILVATCIVDVAGTGVVTAGTTAGTITIRGTDATTGAKSDGTLTLTVP